MRSEFLDRFLISDNRTDIFSYLFVRFQLFSTFIFFFLNFLFQMSEMQEYTMNTMRELVGIYGLPPEVAESILKQLPIAAFGKYPFIM